MTAQNFIDKIRPLLAGTNVQDDDNILLVFLNMAKDSIASDTYCFVDSEVITLTTETKYTLTNIPLQIIDIYDTSLDVLTRGKLDTKGYFQTLPNKIELTYTPTVGDELFVNYYITPSDYALTDDININPMLNNAMKFYILDQVISIGKSEREIQNSSKYTNLYDKEITKYLAKTNTYSVESLVDVDLIAQKGLV